MMENSTVPSSGIKIFFLNIQKNILLLSKLFWIAGESPNEDRSEGEDPASTPNTATTTSSPKKESEKESEKIIPGKKLF